MRNDLEDISYTSRAIAYFVSNFVAMATRVVNLNDTVELTVPENHTLEPKITTLCCTQPKLRQFEEFLNFPHRRHCIFFEFFE